MLRERSDFLSMQLIIQAEVKQTQLYKSRMIGESSI